MEKALINEIIVGHGMQMYIVHKGRSHFIGFPYIAGQIAIRLLEHGGIGMVVWVNWCALLASISIIIYG